ncbi:hypothetical protein LINGRAHAP2_LOCUS29512 [Linum grandiflorum]
MEKKSPMKLTFIIAALLILAAGWENTGVEGEHYTLPCKQWCTVGKCKCNNKDQCVCHGTRGPLDDSDHGEYVVTPETLPRN